MCTGRFHLFTLERNPVKTQYWLMKTEPDVYSISDFQRDKTTIWEGVRNFQARNFMKSMKKGDLVLFYHSNCDDKGVVGIGQVHRESFPDPSGTNPKSEYYDERCQKNPELWMTVELKWSKNFRRLVSLEDIKNTVELSEMRLVKKGNRLSVLPVTEKEFSIIAKKGE